MSVGICIINHNGIALAADSAGTVGANSMFYNSMNKIFSLSNKNIIGAITYGNTRINDVLVDQVLKEFRRYLDNRLPINDFYEIENEFINYIKNNDEYYGFSQVSINEVNTIVTRLLVIWKQRIDNGISSLNNLNSTNVSNITSISKEDTVEKIIEKIELEVNKNINYIKFDYSKDIEKNFEKIIEDKVLALFPSLTSLSTEKQKLINIIKQYINIEFNRTNSLGLFIVGYGLKSAFPKFIHLSIFRVIGGELKYILTDKGPKANEVIIPLAQPDVIFTFCRGISNELQSKYSEINQKLIMNQIDNLESSKFTIEQKDILKKAFGCHNQFLDSSINSYIMSRNVEPLFSGLKYLPIPEMAKLAENLINITTLRRRYVLDGNQQTVGGPTDVAVLSKIDGFIWIKRKHYFDMALNPSFSSCWKNEHFTQQKKYNRHYTSNKNRRSII